jgi:magnesium transporter
MPFLTRRGRFGGRPKPRPGWSPPAWGIWMAAVGRPAQQVWAEVAQELARGGDARSYPFARALAQRVRHHALGPYRQIALPCVRYDADQEVLTVEELTVLAGPGLVVTVAPTQDGPAHRMLTALEKALDAPAPETAPWWGAGTYARRQVAAGKVLSALLALGVEQVFPVLGHLSERTQELERAQAPSDSDALARSLLAHKRRLASLRQVLAQVRDTVVLLQQNPPRGMGRLARRLSDVEQHLSQAMEMVEAERDQVSAILSFHLSSASNHLNRVIKTLTVLATVLLPFTVVSGVYGMNFPIPETRWRYGYVFALSLMVAGTAFLLWYFRRRRWL